MNSINREPSYYLCGDIGGTKTLLAIGRSAQGRDEIVHEQRFESERYSEFSLVLGEFLDLAPSWMLNLSAACLGVAGPIEDNEVKVTNLSWHLSGAQIAERLNIERVLLMNDFEAVAYGVHELQPGDILELQRGTAVAHAPELVIGAGTGLGISYIVRLGETYKVIPTEAGRTAFAPTDAVQLELWRYLQGRFGRATFELVLSGPGLERLYDFLRQAYDQPESEAVRAAMLEESPAAVIARYGNRGDDALCAAALELFAQCYGARAGDLALTLLTRGGVWIAGGIAPKILSVLTGGVFMKAFNDKHTFSHIVSRMPVRVVLNERVGLLGACAVARELAGVA